MNESQFQRFSIPNIPSNARWGTGANQTYLCIDNKPIIVWIPGELVSTTFYDNEGYPAKSASILLRPVRATDAAHAKGLLQSLASNAENPQTRRRDSIYASRRQTQPDNPQPTEIDVIFDATRLLQAHVKMQQVPPRQISRNDVVLLQAHITRYRIDSENKPTYRGLWNTYCTSFNIISISLFARGPDDPIPEEVPDNDLDLAL